MSDIRPQRFNTRKVFRLTRTSQKTTMPAFAVNLSSNGLLVETKTRLAIGEMVEVDITCQRQGKKIKIEGLCQVVRQTQHRAQNQFGLTFVNKFVQNKFKDTFNPLEVHSISNKALFI